MKKALVVFGTRPEAIKMAPLVKALKARPDLFDTKICVTAQHRDMLDQVMDVFSIIADYDLDLMQPGQTLSGLTARVLLGMEEVLAETKPDIVFVHGDTTTSSTAALAAFYAQIDVAHIEAGLRTNNLHSPWPEEANRQITGRLAKWHFAPTKRAEANLLAENVSAENICITGNTVIDALFLARKQMDTDETKSQRLAKQIADKGYKIQSGRKLVLITAHRRENFGEGFKNICGGIADLAEKYPASDFVYPVHLNPNVQKPVYETLGQHQNVYLIDPLDYEPFIWLMDKADIVLTDSGGIQEEAPSLGKPVIVMRDTTERPEALEAGTVQLVGTDRALLVSAVSNLLDDKALYQKMSAAHNPYGDGLACDRIIDFLEAQYDGE